MKISATSALVLNWTDYKLWQSPKTLAYYRQLDLSEGKQLYNLFSEDENIMHTQAVSGRKYFMKKKVFSFLEDLRKQGQSGQVVILAAGLAPLSVEIASFFPTSCVFDVDKYLMDDKKELVKGNPANIEFIECDITDVNLLRGKLLIHNFKMDKPTIVVMEGIIYYLPQKSFKHILYFLKHHDFTFVGDFCLKPELVAEKTRFYLNDVFKKIKEEIKLDFVNFYSPEEIIDILKEAGYKNISVSNMQQIQEERTGNIYPFSGKDMCWVMNIFGE